jgi:hypothetical protein
VDLSECDLSVMTVYSHPYTLAQDSTPGGGGDLTCAYI